MKIETRRLSTILILALFTTSFALVYAIPGIPHKFYGTVTIDGAPAPDGTMIYAMIETPEDYLIFNTTTTGGSYGWDPTFIVPADDPDTPEIDGGLEGDYVLFFIGDDYYAGYYIFENGATTELNLEMTTSIYQITLFEGWNLIGVPFIPEDPSIEVMLYGILDYIESVWTYEAYTGTWLSYAPGAPSDLTEIRDGQGYWIKVSTTFVWELDIGARAPPQAELSFWDIPTVMTVDDTIPAGERLSDIVVHRLQIHNIDDTSDTDIVGPLFHVETEGVPLTWVDWESYADWDVNYAEWDFHEFILTEELGEVGPNFGVDRQEMITLDFEMNRPPGQPVITESGIYPASFTLEFTDIDCVWCNGYIVAHGQWYLDASIASGSFTTTAPLQDWGEDWDEDVIHRVWFDLDLDLLELGVVYEFSVDIDVDVTDTTGSILYKPGFGINYLVSEEWRNGVEGDTVEIPADMRPDYVTAAWVSTDASNIWTLGRFYEINAYMHEVEEQI